MTSCRWLLVRATTRQCRSALPDVAWASSTCANSSARRYDSPNGFEATITGAARELTHRDVFT